MREKKLHKTPYLVIFYKHFGWNALNGAKNVEMMGPFFYFFILEMQDFR